MAEPLSYVQLEGRRWPHPRIGQAVLALVQGDSILPLVTSHPAVAGLTSAHDPVGQYPQTAKEKAANLLRPRITNTLCPASCRSGNLGHPGLGKQTCMDGSCSERCAGQDRKGVIIKQSSTWVCFFRGRVPH